MKNLKLGDIVEYKVENEPYILVYCGACFYSLIQLDASGRFVALSTPRVARIQPIESSSIPVYEYKLLKLETVHNHYRAFLGVYNQCQPYDFDIETSR